MFCPTAKWLNGSWLGLGIHSWWVGQCDACHSAALLGTRVVSYGLTGQADEACGACRSSSSLCLSTKSLQRNDALTLTQSTTIVVLLQYCIPYSYGLLRRTNGLLGTSFTKNSGKEAVISDEHIGADRLTAPSFETLLRSIKDRILQCTLASAGAESFLLTP